MLQLKKEFNYYLKHQEQLVSLYNGKVLVIKERKVIGAYSSEMEALAETLKMHKRGTFLIQRCGPGSDLYTITLSYLSRGSQRLASPLKRKRVKVGFDEGKEE